MSDLHLLGKWKWFQFETETVSGEAETSDSNWLGIWIIAQLFPRKTFNQAQNAI